MEDSLDCLVVRSGWSVDGPFAASATGRAVRLRGSEVARVVCCGSIFVLQECLFARLVLSVSVLCLWVVCVVFDVVCLLLYVVVCCFVCVLLFVRGV